MSSFAYQGFGLGEFFRARERLGPLLTTFFPPPLLAPTSFLALSSTLYRLADSIDRLFDENSNPNSAILRHDNKLPAQQMLRIASHRLLDTLEELGNLLQISQVAKDNTDMRWWNFMEALRMSGLEVKLEEVSERFAFLEWKLGGMFFQTLRRSKVTDTLPQLQKIQGALNSLLLNHRWLFSTPSNSDADSIRTTIASSAASSRSTIASSSAASVRSSYTAVTDAGSEYSVATISGRTYQDALNLDAMIQKFQDACEWMMTSRSISGLGSSTSSGSGSGGRFQWRLQEETTLLVLMHWIFKAKHSLQDVLTLPPMITGRPNQVPVSGYVNLVKSAWILQVSQHAFLNYERNNIPEEAAVLMGLLSCEVINLFQRLHERDDLDLPTDAQIFLGDFSVVVEPQSTFPAPGKPTNGTNPPSSPTIGRSMSPAGYQPTSSTNGRNNAQAYPPINPTPPVPTSTQIGGGRTGSTGGSSDGSGGAGTGVKQYHWAPKVDGIAPGEIEIMPEEFSTVVLQASYTGDIHGGRWDDSKVRMFKKYHERDYTTVRILTIKEGSEESIDQRYLHLEETEMVPEYGYHENFPVIYLRRITRSGSAAGTHGSSAQQVTSMGTIPIDNASLFYKFQNVHDMFTFQLACLGEVVEADIRSVRMVKYKRSLVGGEHCHYRARVQIWKEVSEPAHTLAPHHSTVARSNVIHTGRSNPDTDKVLKVHSSRVVMYWDGVIVTFFITDSIFIERRGTSGNSRGPQSGGNRTLRIRPSTHRGTFTFKNPTSVKARTLGNTSSSSPLSPTSSRERSSSSASTSSGATGSWASGAVRLDKQGLTIEEEENGGMFEEFKWFEIEFGTGQEADQFFKDFNYALIERRKERINREQKLRDAAAGVRAGSVSAA